MIIEQFTDLAGKIRIRWQDELTNNTYNLKFNSEPTIQQIQKIVDELNELESLHQTETISDFSDIKDIVVNIIVKLQQNPNLTFNQYATYLQSLDWAQSLKTRNFILTSMSLLAQRKNIDLTNQTEKQIFERFQSFVLNLSNRKIAKIFFNQFDL